MRAELTFFLCASLLLAGCSGEGDGPADRDGDGVNDDVETRERAITIHRLAGPETRKVTSDPDDRDTDDDGVPDGSEHGYGIDPRDPDTDDDGYLDGPDATPDNAALADAWRRQGILEAPPGTFLGELSRCPRFGGLKPDMESSDRPVPDALGDAAELQGWNVTLRGETRHVVSDPCLTDTDADGLPDDAEQAAGSDPTLADSDADGAPDGQDADPARDLSLLLRDINATKKSGGNFSLRFAVGAEGALVSVPGARSATVAVDDQAPSRRSLVVALLVTAHDPEGNVLQVTSTPGGAILYIDLVQGGAAVGDAPRQLGATRFSFEGPDGSVAFSWATLRE